MPFCNGEEARAIREWKATMGRRGTLRLFTLEVFLRLRGLGHRACMELI